MNGGWSANGNGGNKSGNGGGNQPGLTRTWTEPSGHRKSPSMWNDEAKSLNGKHFAYFDYSLTASLTFLLPSTCRQHDAR